MTKANNFPKFWYGVLEFWPSAKNAASKIAKSSFQVSKIQTNGQNIVLWLNIIMRKYSIHYVKSNYYTKILVWGSETWIISYQYAAWTSGGRVSSIQITGSNRLKNGLKWSQGSALGDQGCQQSLLIPKFLYGNPQILIMNQKCHSKKWDPKILG